MMHEQEVMAIMERKLQTCRPSFTAKLRGRRYEIFLGADGQLWRWIDTEECRLGIQPSNFGVGQYTVASYPEEVFDFCKNFGVPGPDRDRFLERIAWVHYGRYQCMWMQLCQERLAHGKYL